MEKLLAYLNSLRKEPRQRFVERCNTSEAYLRDAPLPQATQEVAHG